ncbi:MAG: hypothetical protein JXA42_24405 [Anaerolineales bacterium]|nr:hypothetical protein [Anaerolineales bacterium]
MSRYLVLSLEGGHYSMGQQHGRQVRALRPSIEQAIRVRLQQIDEHGPDEHFEGLLQETREALEESDPAFLSMIRGQANALELDFDRLLRYDLVSYLCDDLIIRQRSGAEGCTTWSAVGPATVDGQAILGKNRDYRLEHLALQVVVRARPKTGYRYVYASSASSPGVFCSGINQAGLAVADTHVVSRDLGPGLPDSALMMHLLEEHDSVASAIDFLCSAPRMGRNNLIMADAQGHTAVFEIGRRNFGVLKNRDGILVNTNHFVSDPMKDFFVDTNPPITFGNSFKRFDKASALLDAARGQIDAFQAKKVLSAHDGILSSICRHSMEGSDSMTISASICLPVQKKMLFCYGLPCQGNYDEYSLENPN